MNNDTLIANFTSNPSIDTSGIGLYAIGCGVIILITVLVLFASVRKDSCLYNFYQWLKLKLYVCCCCLMKKDPQKVQQKSRDLQSLLNEIEN